MQTILHKKYVTVQNRVPWTTAWWAPWATQQMTNDSRSFTLPITIKKSVSKGFYSA